MPRKFPVKWKAENGEFVLFVFFVVPLYWPQDRAELKNTL